MTLPYTPWPAAVAERYRELGVWQDKTLYEHFLAAATRCHSNQALISDQPSLTYNELLEQVNRLAAGLRDYGLSPGQVVVIQLGHSPEFFVLLLACFQVGIVPVMALPAHGLFEISHFSQQTGAKLLVTSGSGGPDGLRTIDISSSDGSSQWQQLLAYEPDERFVRLGEDCPDVALLQVSGGTTGVPKLIPRCHNDYAYSIIQSNRRCATSEATRMLVVLPCGHNFPLSSPGSLGVLFAGGAVIIAPSGRAGVALPMASQHQATTAALVPALLTQWVLSPAKYDLSTLQTLQVGGQRLDPTLASKAMAKLGVQIQQVFGMAEGLVCYTPLDADEDTVLHSQGLPMSPYDELVIVDDDDQPVADGEAGHLITRGPYTIRGYFRADAHNKTAFTADGFYRTGDIVRLRPDGQLQVCGRSKEQVNRGGEKIPCLEVETLVLEHPAIAYASLIGVPDKFLGEKSVLFVVTNLQDPTAAVREHLNGLGIAAFKIPDRVIAIAEMPVTAVGKIDKKALAGLAAPPAPLAAGSSARVAPGREV